MLKQIDILNYKCFENHSIKNINPITIIVGKNNSGKSTLIEILRILAYFLNIKRKIIKQFPKSGVIPLNEKGCSYKVHFLENNAEDTFYLFNQGPAILFFKFSNHISIKIYVFENGECFAITYSRSKILNKITSEINGSIPKICILPQIGPLQKNEPLLNEEYVKKSLGGHLQSHHFRNQLHYLSEYYNKFKEITENTWDKIEVRSFDACDNAEYSAHQLILRVDKFISEAGSVGFGLQIWIQLIWFLAQNEHADLIILDEPDSYLHADIQRKIISTIKQFSNNFIIATHSIEIINSTDSKNIMLLDKTKKYSSCASENILKRVRDDLGAIQNFELIKFFQNKKVIVYEGDGDDVKILNALLKKIQNPQNFDLRNFGILKCGGWGGWQKVIGIQNLISKTNAGTLYCIFDSDYHTKHEIETRIQQATECNIHIHILQRKEVENYLIDSRAIKLAILQYGKDVLESQIEILIENILNDLKISITDDFATELWKSNKKDSIKTINEKARTRLESSWGCLSDKIKICPGKIVINEIIKQVKEKYEVNISKYDILEQINTNDNDIIKLYNLINN